MIKKLILAIALVAAYIVADMDVPSIGLTGTGNTCMAAAPNDGTFLRTNLFVSVFSESGTSKGVFRIYLHRGNRYIDFNNTWVNIQGKRRFAYNGNWYIIK